MDSADRSKYKETVTHASAEHREKRRTLIVTGGARGIGAAVCKLAAASGYDVVVQYRERAEHAAAIVAQARLAGSQAVALAADVRRPEHVARLFEEARAHFGAVDALVNCAGVTGRAAHLADVDPAVMQETLDTNAMGTLLCCREAVRTMARSRGGNGGAIVNLSSGAATLGSPGEYVWYAASKGAVDSLTLGLAKEVASDGIRVNAVSPGLTDTDLHALSTGEPQRLARLAPTVPMNRAASAEEIAAPVLWLLSDAASYVTGAILRVAGGR